MKRQRGEDDDASVVIVEGEGQGVKARKVNGATSALQQADETGDNKSESTKTSTPSPASLETTMEAAQASPSSKSTTAAGTGRPKRVKKAPDRLLPAASAAEIAEIDKGLAASPKRGELTVKVRIPRSKSSESKATSMDKKAKVMNDDEGEDEDDNDGDDEEFGTDDEDEDDDADADYHQTAQNTRRQSRSSRRSSLQRQKEHNLKRETGEVSLRVLGVDPAAFGEKLTSRIQRTWVRPVSDAGQHAPPLSASTTVPIAEGATRPWKESLAEFVRFNGGILPYGPSLYAVASTPMSTDGAGTATSTTTSTTSAAAPVVGRKLSELSPSEQASVWRHRQRAQSTKGRKNERVTRQCDNEVMEQKDEWNCRERGDVFGLEMQAGLDPLRYAALKYVHVYRQVALRMAIKNRWFVPDPRPAPVTEDASAGAGRSADGPNMPSRGNRIRYYHEVPRDKLTGQVIMPLKIKGLTVESLGHVLHDQPKFHSRNYIWPLGYASRRRYLSVINPPKPAEYHCEIASRGGAPLFVVTLDDKNAAGEKQQRVFEATTASGVWQKIANEASQYRQSGGARRTLTQISGPEMFGYANPTIMHLVQTLPNAEKCERYAMKDLRPLSEMPAASSESEAAKRKRIEMNKVVLSPDERVFVAEEREQQHLAMCMRTQHLRSIASLYNDNAANEGTPNHA